MPDVDYITEPETARQVSFVFWEHDLTATESEGPIEVWLPDERRSLLIDDLEESPPMIASPPIVNLAPEFGRLAGQWKKDTRFTSSLNKRSMHPAYQRIIGMGPAALTLIFQDLEETRSHWLWALCAITGNDPAPQNATFDEAVDAWLTWGKSEGYL